MIEKEGLQRSLVTHYWLELVWKWKLAYLWKKPKVLVIMGETDLSGAT
jgi:hypothetical protein